MKKDRIIVKKSQIPYRITIPLNDVTFMLEFRYNSECDLFTVALCDRDGNRICIEPLIYGVELFKSHYKAGIYPAVKIVPLDESGENTAVTWNNFNETVFLTLDNAG